MDRTLEETIAAIPAERFQEDRTGFAGLTPLERLRWLQQTAWFIWRHRGVAHRAKNLGPTPPRP